MHRRSIGKRKPITARRRVRITSGYLKGKKLVYPDLRSLRPTMQRAKIAIFDAIEEHLKGAVFLDLFAGAGGMGIEALSRGASFAHFVENDLSALDMLKRNLELCSLGEGECSVHRSDVPSFLEMQNLDELGVEVIFIDPPYESKMAFNVLEILQKKRYHMLRMVVMEYDKPLTENSIMGFEVIKARRFGQTVVTFLRQLEGESS